MKKVRAIISGIIWTVLGLYLALMAALHIPAIQRATGAAVANVLQQKLGTEVQVGRVDLGFLNRLIIDDVLIRDQSRQKMLQASRVSAKLDVWSLLKDGCIHIASAQLFGMKANLYRRTADTAPNFQFALDSLASKDDSGTPLDLRIQSLVIRHGAVTYHQLDAPATPQKFNPRHLSLSNISTHLMLNTLTDDSLSLHVKKLALQEASGLHIESLAFKLLAGKHEAVLSQLRLQLPQSLLHIDLLKARYQLKNGQPDPSSLRFNLNINKSEITPSDIAFFIPELKNFKSTVSVVGNADGSADDIRVNSLRVNSSTGSIGMKGSGSITQLHSTPAWQLHVDDLKLSAEGIQFIARNLKGQRVEIPDEVVRLGNIRFQGHAGGQGQRIAGRGNLHTDAGDAKFDIALQGKAFRGMVQSAGFNLARLLNNPQFGMTAANLTAEGTFPTRILAKGVIPRFDYNGHTYQQIQVDGTYDNGNMNGALSLNDPNGQLDLKGLLHLSEKTPKVNLTASVHHFNPGALNLTTALGNRTFDFEAQADFTGRTLEYANGFVNIDQFTMTDNGKPFHVDNLHINTGYQDEEHYVDLQSDFGNVLIRGQYNYETLPQSFINLIASRLPSLPGLPAATRQSTNDFAIIANIHDATLANEFLHIPLTLHQPLHIKGFINDKEQLFDADIDMPDFTYDGNRFNDGQVYVTTQDNRLVSKATINKVADDGRQLSLDVQATAADNKLETHLIWDAHSKTELRGVLNAEAEFFKNEQQQDAAHIRIHPSEVMIDNTAWQLQPSDIVYSKDRLNIDHFQLSNNNQHIIVSGLATKNPEDSVTVDLQDIDVAYILNLVDFHSVSFSGLASGKAVVQDIFGSLRAHTDLQVKDFHFQDGKMGVLHAHANYNTEEGQVNIAAVAADEAPFGQTVINGYISPKNNYIDLDIRAHDTRIAFVESFCGSFMDNVNAHANGTCRVFGDLNEVNLEGLMVADGELDITSLNTHYTLRNDTIVMIPNEIIFPSDTIYDRNGHLGIVDGALHHKNLGSITFDIDVEAQDLLAYDFHDYGNQSFYGTVYGTGRCTIEGRKNAINFDIDVTPGKGSFIEYNAAGPEGISNSEFIEWVTNTDVTPTKEDNTYLHHTHVTTPLRNIHSDLRLNFTINATPDFTLRVLMDEQTGDKIALNGEGALHANYFNKGSFDMFGNYLISYGTYTMTIQTVIKKAFVFQPGSSIVFSGDPFNASLNLKGQYVVPAVSLSDLQMGDSFTHNSVRVNCLMNIGGTAGAPTVTFGLDMPTLSADAQQMIRSVINSEEDMNQQVLYLLAVGRFMPQGNNNATEEGTQQSQTSLAMQSLLSGTISQQLNTVLSNVVKSNNWNFGANISTGDEGWNNAEYEGLLRGRLLDNRLLINGEFGYRDNVNTQDGSSFIGDFDVQYLLLPNGNLAVKVYNETNDRYFTRNSLTTQGIGLIMKKDFTNLSELVSKKKKARKKVRKAASPVSK